MLAPETIVREKQRRQPVQGQGSEPLRQRLFTANATPNVNPNDSFVGSPLSPALQEQRRQTETPARTPFSIGRTPRPHSDRNLSTFLRNTPTGLGESDTSGSASFLHQQNLLDLPAESVNSQLGETSFVTKEIERPILDPACVTVFGISPAEAELVREEFNNLDSNCGIVKSEVHPKGNYMNLRYQSVVRPDGTVESRGANLAISKDDMSFETGGRRINIGVKFCTDRAFCGMVESREQHLKRLDSQNNETPPRPERPKPPEESSWIDLFYQVVGLS